MSVEIRQPVVPFPSTRKWPVSANPLGKKFVVPANRESRFRETLPVIGYAVHHAKRT